MDAVKAWGFFFLTFFFVFPFSTFHAVVFWLVSALLLLLLQGAVCCLGARQVIKVCYSSSKKFRQCYRNGFVTSGSKLPSNRAELARGETAPAKDRAWLPGHPHRGTFDLF